MKRRNFIMSSGKAGAALLLLPSQVLMGYPDNRFEPYRYSMKSAEFSKKLKTRFLSQAVRESEVVTDSTGIGGWAVGEGKFASDMKVIELSKKIERKKTPPGFTPVFLLSGKDFEVYGQFYRTLQGQKGLIRGFDGNFYTVHPSFESLFTHKYICYGLPAADYSLESCYKCGRIYVRQALMSDCKSKAYYAYAWANQCNKGGTCNDLKIQAVGPCINSDKLGVDW